MVKSSKLYLIRWNNDGELQVTDGFNIEAMRHSERKNYGGEHQFVIIREATEQDKIEYGVNGRPYKKKRLFVDMDGTMAVWRDADYFEQLLEKGYFENLPSQQNVVDAIRIIIDTRDDIEVHSLSAYLIESHYAVSEKNQWLDKQIPEIDKEHRFFCMCGTSKSGFIRARTGCFNENDFLLDDYSNNLHQWAEDGGVGIKLYNGINGTNGTWHGNFVKAEWAPEKTAEAILNLIDSVPTK